MLDLDQWLDPLITIVIGELYRPARAFDEAASLRSPILDEAEAASSGAASNESSRRNDFLRLSMPESLCLSSSRKAAIMAEINKLSVEKALDKLRAGDAKQSKDALFNDKIDVLDEEIERMRTRRLRLEQHQRSRDKTIVEAFIR